MRILLLLILAFSINVLDAQETNNFNYRFKTGILFGLNRAKFYSNFDFYENPKYGFDFGMFVEPNIGKGFSLVFSLCIVNSGGRTVNYDVINEWGEKTGDHFWFNSNLQFIQIPIHVNWTYPISNFNVSVFMGPNFSYLLSANEEFDTDYQTDYNESRDIKNWYKEFYFSADIGASFCYSLNPVWTLMLKSTYTHGITDQNKTEGFSQKMRDIKLYLGLVLVL